MSTRRGRPSREQSEREAAVRRLESQAVTIGPHQDGQHADLNAAARRSGFTQAQIDHAHRVARGEAALSEACPECEEQELYYNRAVLYEGRAAIQCRHCGCTCVDRNEQGGIGFEVSQMLKAHAAQGKAPGRG